MKVVDETNSITYDNIFIIMLPLFSCQSSFDIPLLPFIQSFESGLLLYTMYTCLLENSEAKTRPLNVYITLVIIITCLS